MEKLALDNAAKKTPNGIAECHYEMVSETIWNIHPINEMWGIGQRTAANIYRLGIDSVYSLSTNSAQSLKRTHRIIGEQLFYYAHGIDQSIIAQNYIPLSNSFSKSQILDRDYIDQYEIEVVIREMADQVAIKRSGLVDGIKDKKRHITI
ncbi:hypothetical protein CAT7_00050 [Carnobacterium sp. AT7]|uniref:hypothetical protein n=1 Tax=Carnobacterium TaxID=2747 RepID=UPI00015EF70F|nr:MULTISPECIES: hypothetical protein [Carnobacterium]EDP67802.1 hypothetical protein CAT7_00050 [Carnobacterium sp. AT7]